MLPFLRHRMPSDPWAGPVTSGSSNRTTTGVIAIPNYNTLTVTVEGGQGSPGSSGADLFDSFHGVNYTGGAGGAGGVGGKSVRVYTHADGPLPGTSVPVSISGGTAQFTFSTNPHADVGGTGGNGTDAFTTSGGGGEDAVYHNGSDGSTGTSGAASGGTTNTTGGSTTSTPRVTLAWS